MVFALNPSLVKTVFTVRQNTKKTFSILRTKQFLPIALPHSYNRLLSA